jgi:hypothetical protein
MKMVKSLLLGSAAGLVSVTAGQAADLPVKAQPVQYVKVCSLYGAGFYYMPGTDMCIKIGGWTRAEITEGANGNMTWGPFNGNLDSRATSNVAMRARGYITADAREMTAYGVARGYIAAGLNTNDVGLQVANLVDSVNRGYVQWAGFTAGLAQSFYDFYSVPAATYRGGYFPASDTGDGGWWVWGYTAQFGGGFSATLSAEARRTTQIIDSTCAAGGNATAPNGANLLTPTCGAVNAGAYPTAITGPAPLATGSGISPGLGAYGGQQMPDIVANLRLDQAWGSAQVMGAYHQVNPSYYGSESTGAGSAFNSSPNIASGANPGNYNGWAVGAGLKINFPTIAAGDYFQTQANYTQGALRYLFNTPNTNYGQINGNNMAYGVLSDCVYGGSTAGVNGALVNTTGCQLTTAWGINASYEHYWTPNWHESFFGNYYVVDYNASANNQLCSVEGFGNGLQGSAASANTGCNNNWNTWGAGSRLQWDITKSMYIGVEAMYEVMDSATHGSTGTASAVLPAGIATLQASGFENSASAWNFSMRIHKDFLP